MNVEHIKTTTVAGRRISYRRTCEKVKVGFAIMGLEQTLKKMRIEERYEGEQTAKVEIAKRMIDLGLDAAVIAVATGFSHEQIEQLQKSY